uniref:Uncharacterized protein n=1 Tax=Cryptomonas curvata TaxID=233186 RepID=A0A7S0MN66_9CRYP|mmetsp:Transcript_49522/g.103304  ORF Transcript_49522/g.103304 Transcript_49522/m.103304 type:complete len:145 (+) Transcript_49522:3-437(+)
MANWNSGLCSCIADPGGVQACCLGFCCTGVLYSLNVEKLARPHECVLGGSCVGAGVVWYSLSYSGLCCIAQCVTRGAIRKKYSISGNVACDFLITCCCCCCSVIQDYNQLHSKESTPDGIPAVARNFGQSEGFTVLNSMEPAKQ